MRLLLCVLGVCFFLVGCWTSEKENANEKNRNDMVQTKNVTYKKENNKSDEEVGQHLANLAASIPGVKDATAVVVGDYAVVGIDVGAKLDRSRVESIKYSVAESLKHDPRGANAVVVADIDTFERLKEMGKEIREGDGGEGVLDELAAIVGRVMPQIPNELLENNDKEPVKENDKQVPEQDEKELKKQQEEQSNHHMDR
ncbi:YhcN/YlaJ family sporulation lipoprotein [Bacillus manliponensis]|uniref:YhcN/YlaJ family sporulation lipoprotein n=1 Tax=Bacillus manliponensis TaxID=574376 RepID=UPI003511ABBD